MVWSRKSLGLPLALVALAVGLFLMMSSQAYETLRESAFDVGLNLRALPQPVPPIVIVDIDRSSLAELGAWPWSRERLAALVARVADAKPRVIGLEILIEGPDERSPAALARKLADVARRPDLIALAETLEDGNVALAAALRRIPTVLGLALDAEGVGRGPPAAPALIGGEPDFSGLWQASGAIGPVAMIADATAGFGMLPLPGDGDGRIRNVPLLVMTAGVLRPGFALEITRLAREAGAYVIDGAHKRLGVGDLNFTLTSDAMLRLRPTPDETHRVRTISAVELMQSPDTGRRMKDAIVLIGTSAPEIGGLRPSVSGSLVPTVQIQADAIVQMLAGDHPHRPSWLPWFEVAALGFASLVAAAIAMRHPPLFAFTVVAGLGFAWLAFAVLALDAGQLLVDPLIVPLGVGAAFAIAAFISAARVRVREAAIRRRFEQQLPAAVVRRLLDRPELLKLAGEARYVTAMFTDIEGFTSMTERAGPVALVELLDRYFDGLVRVIVEHGGMVEKIVGDGVHAIFNAPLDLQDHQSKAVACAIAIQIFAERFRHEGEAQRLQFGSTRIGIESGDVILGDVGGGRRLDYTAHGDVMNTASRLESANKDIGSRICIGPVAAQALDPDLIRPLGRIDVRGRSKPLSVFEPWPPAMTSGDRAAFGDAARLSEHDQHAAAAAFAHLSQRYPLDQAMARLADRLTRRSGEPL